MYKFFSIYFSFAVTSNNDQNNLKTIIIFLISEKDKKIIKEREFLSSTLDENLIPTISSWFNELDITIENIEKIYLTDLWSTWNSNRLITFFCKLCDSFKNKKIYKISRQFEESEKNSIFLERKEFHIYLKSAEEIKEFKNFVPFYNKCAIINT